MPKRTATAQWRQAKANVIERDGGRCHLCDGYGAETADHLVPTSLGGAWYDEANLAAAHSKCNRIRGNRSITWARNEIARRLAGSEATINGWTW